jgi:uncharacterized protein with LGFP repeats
MREMSMRSAALAAAITAVALIGSGCHANTSTETKRPATPSATSAPSATSSVGVSTTPSAAGPSTQMPGANGTSYTVQGLILTKYQSLPDAAKKDLGAPTHEQVTNTDGGEWLPFDGGVIIYKTPTAAYVVWGKIRDAWIALGGSQGKLGYPTSDEVDSPDGQKKQTFEHGVLTWKPGENEATVSYS